MHPPSSSTSSSNGTAPSTGTAATVAFWFLVVLIVFEVLCWYAFTHTPLRHASIRSYFWYGESYEGKLRELVATPNLPSNSILYAGWINETRLQGEPTDVDVTFYGSSFAGNLATAMGELRPDLRLRVVGGPGAPLNHSYGIYQIDRKLRKTRVAVIGVVSENVGQTLTLNSGSVLTVAAMPYFFPRFDLVGGRIERTGESLINSADELRHALDDPALWRRQLDVLAAHDDGYHRFLFAADVFDHSLMARLVRRGLAKRHAEAYGARVYGTAGFNKEAYQIQVFRALLLRFISDLRVEGVEPVVVLIATRGYKDNMRPLVEDLLKEHKVPFVNSFDLCPSTDQRNYVADGHFTHACDLKTARDTLTVVEAVIGRTSK